MCAEDEDNLTPRTLSGLTRSTPLRETLLKSRSTSSLSCPSSTSRQATQVRGGEIVFIFGTHSCRLRTTLTAEQRLGPIDLLIKTTSCLQAISGQFRAANTISSLKCPRLFAPIGLLCRKP